MLAARKRRRSQNGMLLAALALCLYFVAVYQPLSRRAAALDQPLLDLWTELAHASTQVTGPDDAQLPKLDEAFASVQNARAILDRSRLALLQRTALPPELTHRIRSPFQLIEFQNERQLTTEQIWRLARQKQVQLDPKLAGGFPEYFADRRRPALLWAQLRLLQDLLTLAISCEVSLVQSVSSPPAELFASAPTTTDARASVPVQIELVGGASAILRFLECLPLRTDEIASRGLPAAPPGKPSYFIDQLLIRKESRDKPEEVRLRALVRSFVDLNRG